MLMDQRTKFGLYIFNSGPAEVCSLRVVVERRGNERFLAALCSLERQRARGSHAQLGPTAESRGDALLSTLGAARDNNARLGVAGSAIK